MVRIEGAQFRSVISSSLRSSYCSSLSLTCHALDEKVAQLDTSEAVPRAIDRVKDCRLGVVLLRAVRITATPVLGYLLHGGSERGHQGDVDKD